MPARAAAALRKTHLRREGAMFWRENSPEHFSLRPALVRKCSSKILKLKMLFSVLWVIAELMCGTGGRLLCAI
jgi:hypothetical protein